MTDRALPRCRQADRIVGVVLDGTDTASDRLHAGTCPRCSMAVDRARAFGRSLGRVAVEASDSMPDPGALPSQGRFGVGVSGAALRLATLGAAVAAGLLIAAIIGLRTPDPAAVGAFASEASARASLDLLDLPCRDVSGATICEVATGNHAHRVELIGDAKLAAAVATIENTDGSTLDRAGGDVLFGDIAAALLAPDPAAAVQAWLLETYPTCRAACSAAIDGVDVAMSADRTSVTLTLRGP